jgi:sulfate-transporting ATPase
MKAMKQELEWVRSNPKARQAKSKARLARFEEMSSHEYQKRNETQEIFIPVGERLGDKVIEFNGVTKSFGDKLLMDNLSFSIPPGAIVGIIGPNGAGKSTLFKMITGQQQPDSGAVEIGPTVKMAYVDQSRDCLDGSKTVFEELAQGSDILQIGKFEMPPRLHRPLQLQGRRSGQAGRQPVRRRTRPPAPGQDADGRRQRAAARRTVQRPRRRNPARAGRRPARIPGCALVISHDRWFLDRICTHILAAEGDSQWTFFPATTRNTKRTSASAWAKKAPSRSASATSRSPAD